MERPGRVGQFKRFREPVHVAYRALHSAVAAFQPYLPGHRISRPSSISAFAPSNPRSIAWRRDIHQHPELSQPRNPHGEAGRRHLRKLGIEVKTGVGAHRRGRAAQGRQAGPVVALRADMDALPVAEEVGPAVQVHREDRIQRPAGRRHARLRARRPHGHPAGRGRSAGRRARADSRHASNSFSSPPRKARRPAKKAAHR